MGTEMQAFIEYDANEYKWKKWGAAQGYSLQPPFQDEGAIESLTETAGLYTGSKDYWLFGAIAGARNQTGIPPLFSPRGAPSNMNWRTMQNVCPGFEPTGWLTLREINNALNHQNVNRDYLETQ